MSTYTDGSRTVTAKNYADAAIKLYGNHVYSLKDREGTLNTTYVHRRRGYAEVCVYHIGDKQGSYWGVQAAVPDKYVLRKIQ